MKKVLFICRNPIEEYGMRNLVKKVGLASQFYIEASVTCREEIGHPVYPPAQHKLAKHGISYADHVAR